MWDIENDTLGFIKSVSQETKCYKKEWINESYIKIR
jgi:hypothetical protein